MAAAADGLIQWAKLRGAVFHDTKVARHPQGGRGLFNTKATMGEDEQNQTALFVPKSLFITLDTVDEEAKEYPELIPVLAAFAAFTAAGGLSGPARPSSAIATTGSMRRSRLAITRRRFATSTASATCNWKDLSN